MGKNGHLVTILRVADRGGVGLAALAPGEVISRTVLLTIPCTGERKTNFMAELTYGGSVGVSVISASLLCIANEKLFLPRTTPPDANPAKQREE
jgi:hypothetical protein